MTKHSSHQEIFSHNFVIGGIAGIFGKSIIAPIERIKYIFVVSSADIRSPLYISLRILRGQEYRHRNWRPAALAWKHDELCPYLSLLGDRRLKSNSPFMSD